jgi:hypothetical protein
MAEAMFLVQFLLPVKPALKRQFAATRHELLAQYRGVTAYVRAPAKGSWVAASGQEETDDVIMVEVLVDALDRAWWSAYARTLAERFGEEEIHIRALPAESL